jgi:hypothetical protein
MLYATEGIETDADLQKAMVGVASVWCVYLSDRPNKARGLYLEVYTESSQVRGKPMQPTSTRSRPKSQTVDS